jgi:cytochrome c-type biogenesis protein CcmH
MGFRRALSALLVMFALCIVIAGSARAVQPDEVLSDPALEARARAISEGLRCLVCQNQSIDDSSAELARDLRILVRERLAAGDSDAAVLAFVEARYGEFVLLRPRLAPHTLLLWLTPLLLLGGAAYALVRRARERFWVKAGEEPLEDPQAQPLSPAERQRLDALLKRQQG